MPVEFDPDNFNLERLRTNYLDFGIIFNNLDAILQGVLISISLALLAEVLGIILGLVLALLKISRSRILRWPAQVYIDVFRGTPLLVQKPSSTSRPPQSAFGSRACSSPGWWRSP